MTSIIEQIAKPAINTYRCSKYNLTYDELLTCISDHFSKKKKCNAIALQYYYDNKDNPEYQDRLRLSRNTYYNKHRTKIRALTLARYEHDPLFRAEYQRYQAIYSQKRRGCKNANETRGRPSKYSLLETIS